MSSARRGGGARGRGRGLIHGPSGLSRSTNASEDEGSGSDRRDNGNGRPNTTAPNNPRGRGLTRGTGKPFQRPNGSQQQRLPTGPASSTAPVSSSNIRGRGNIRPNGFPARTNGTAGGDSASYEQRYQMLKRRREQERVDAIAQGFLADPNKPRKLSEAITPVGTCQDMCPEYERVERVVQRDVWGPEADPKSSGNGSFRLPIEERMVKKFRRSAAGLDEQLPSDLRPPLVLQKTVDYLFNDVVANAESLGDVHHFVWDRTRAIRNDFSIQQVSKVSDLRIAIDCYERIARFHILSLHQLAIPDKPYEKYDWQQDREQLDRTMLSLMQYYDDSRDTYRSANEAEFRAYCIIFQIQSRIPDMEDKVQNWPAEVVRDPRVQRALKLYAAAGNITDLQGPGSFKPLTTFKVAQQNWQRFWKLVASNEISYLASCACEMYFNLIRRIALTSIWVAYRQGGDRRPEDWTIAELADVLGFDTGEEVVRYCESYGFSIKTRADGLSFLDVASVPGRHFPEPSTRPPDQTFSGRIVEAKRRGRTFSAVINGLSVKAAKQAGLIEAQPAAGYGAQKRTEGGSLFVTDHSDDEEDMQTQAPVNGVNGTAAPSAAPKLNPFASPFSPSGAASNGQPNWGAPPSAPQSGSISFGKPSNAPVNGEHTPTPGLFSFNSTAPTESKPSPPSNPFAPPAQTTNDAVKTNSPFAPTSSATTPTLFGAPSGAASALSFGKPSGVIASSAPATSPAAGTIDTTAPSTSTTTKPIFSFGGPSQAAPTRTSTTSNATPAAKPVFFFGSPSTGASTSNVNTTPASPNPSPFASSSNPTPSFSFGAPSSTPSITASQPQQPQFSSILNNNDSAEGTQQRAVPFSVLTAPLTTSAVPPAASTPKLKDQQAFGESAETSTPPQIQVTPPSKPLSQQSPLPQFDQPKVDSSSRPFTFPTSSATQQSASVPHAGSSAPFNFTPPTISENPTTSASSQTFVPPSIATTSRTISHAQPNIEPAPPAVSSSSQQERQQRRKAKMLDSLASDLVLEPNKGLLKQFIEFTTSSLIFECMEQVEWEKTQRQADDFRRRVLSVRYAKRWVANATRLRLKRQGRERRQRLAKGRVARASEEPSVGDELEAYRTSQKGKEKAVEVGGSSGNNAQQQHPSVDTNGTTQNQASNGVGQATLSNGNTTKRLPRSSIRGHHRSRTQPTVATATPQKSPYRITKRSSAASPAPSTLSARSSLLGCSFLSGASLLGDATPGAKMSTTRTNYFHLKALGIQPEDPWKKDRVARKRSRDDDEDESEPGSPESKRFASPPDRSSMLLERARALIRETPTRSPPRTQQEKAWAEEEAKDEALFARIRAIKQKRSLEDVSAGSAFSPSATKPFTSPSTGQNARLNGSSTLTKNAPPTGRTGPSSTATSTSKTRAQIEAEDEALFARLRAASKAMDESIAFYREEMSREEQLRRSLSSESKETEMQTGQNRQSPQENENRPKYWGRVSAFVPREEYGKGRVTARGKGEGKGEEVVGRGEVDGEVQRQEVTQQSRGGTSVEDAIEL